MHAHARWVSIVTSLSLVFATVVASPALAQRRERAAAPRTGELVIRSTQSGASVYIDEELVGQLPLEARRLPIGEHTLRVQMPGFTDFTDVFNITANRTTELEVELLAVATVLSVSSTPSAAQIFVDERFAGDTPADVEVLEGPHSLRLHLPGYRDLIQEIQAQAGRAQSLSLTLEALPPDEDPTHVVAAPRHWYEKPWTWVAVGVAAVAITVGVILLVSATSGPSQIDEYCMSGQGCVIVQPGF